MSRPQSLLLRHRAPITTLFNLTLAAVAWVIAFALRFDLSVPDRYVPVVVALLPVVLGCKLAGFAALRSPGVVAARQHARPRGHRARQRARLDALSRRRGVRPRARGLSPLDLPARPPPLHGAHGRVRIGIRLVLEQRRRAGAGEVETTALIVGAGSAGIRLLEEIESRRRLRLAVVGFVDDDVAKVGLRVCGTPVLGGIDDLPALVAEHEVGEVLIAIPSASPRSFAASSSTAPPLGSATACCRRSASWSRVVIYTQMREVKVDDLLARDPIRLDVARSTRS